MQHQQDEAHLIFFVKYLNFAYEQGTRPNHAWAYLVYEQGFLPAGVFLINL